MGLSELMRAISIARLAMTSADLDGSMRRRKTIEGGGGAWSVTKVAQYCRGRSRVV